ncbi:MAG: TrmH family RNA methyltransferase [Candidatus Dojkabacteria bacterium]
MLTPRQKKIRRVAKRRQRGVVVVLEDIHDPHNAAAVLRTCEAFGVQEVCFIFEKQERYNPRKIGKTTSSSANKWLDFKVFGSTEECYDDLHSRGYHIYCTALEQTSKSIYDSNFTDFDNVGLVFGNEHAGASRHAIENADTLLEILMRGFVQSLNISVTAGICIFEAT